MQHDIDLGSLSQPVARKVGKPNPTVIRAERSFQKRSYYDTVKQALRAKPVLQKRSVAYKSSKDKMVARGAKLVAISTIRLKGRVTLDRRARLSSRKSVVRKNIVWATTALEHFAAQSKSDPELQTYVAEAYALNPKTQAKALTILSGLAKKDLLVDAHGFAALAKLHTAKNNTKAASVARKRCMTMSSNNALLCNVKASKVNAKRAQTSKVKRVSIAKK